MYIYIYIYIYIERERECYIIIYGKQPKICIAKIKIVFAVAIQWHNFFFHTTDTNLSRQQFRCLKIITLLCGACDYLNPRFEKNWSLQSQHFLMISHMLLLILHRLIIAVFFKKHFFCITILLQFSSIN